MIILLREYGRIVLQRKIYLLLVVLGIFTVAILDLSIPLFYKNIANGLAETYSEATLAILWDNLLYIALTYGVIWLAWRMIEFSMIPLEGGGLNALDKRVFSVLIEQKHLFFENSFSGSLISQSARFVRAFEAVFDWLIFQLLYKAISIVTAFIIFSQSSFAFANYFLIWVVIFITWGVGFSIWRLRFDKATAAASSKVGAAYSDTIANIFVVKSFAMEAQEQRHLNTNADELYRRRKISWLLMFLFFAIQALLTFAIELLLIKMMIEQWQINNFSVGEFILFQAVILVLVRHLWEFTRSFKQIFTAIADASEMAKVFQQVETEKDHPQAKDLTIQHGNIQFDALSFTYQSQERTQVQQNNKHNNKQDNLFSDFNLTIKAGEKIAFVGHSGSGKTSLTKLLFRFFDPQQGSIRIDGVDLRDYSLASLRRQISLVPQQPELFHRSVRDNIALGKDVTDEEVMQAAKQSHSDVFIQQLQEGLDTKVGERGVKLSGGEKQRIALARAFLENAPIVVLDEATSALDSITEQHIQAAIFALIKDKTAIVIAHRLATVLHMDRIIVLEEGKIIEQGTHQTLLDNKGKYYEMWQHQSGQQAQTGQYI